MTGPWAMGGRSRRSWGGTVMTRTRATRRRMWTTRPTPSRRTGSGSACGPRRRVVPTGGSSTWWCVVIVVSVKCVWAKGSIPTPALCRVTPLAYLTHRHYFTTHSSSGATGRSSPWWSTSFRPTCAQVGCTDRLICLRIYPSVCVQVARLSFHHSSLYHHSPHRRPRRQPHPRAAPNG